MHEKVREVCDVGGLKGYEPQVDLLIRRVEEAEFTFYCSSRGAASTIEWTSECLRLAVDGASGLLLLWDLAHEVGHLIDGAPASGLNWTQKAQREESAWSNGWDLLVTVFPTIEGKRTSFDLRRATCLATHYLPVLRERVEADGTCFVRFRGVLSSEEAGVRGTCEPNQSNHRTRIQLFRPKGADAVEPVDLLTLAHEYGHHLSHQKGQRSSSYEAALAATTGEVGWTALATLPDDQKAEVFAEESRAWDYGKAVLAEIGYDGGEWQREHIAASLSHYRDRLSLSH
jgi:hypothetical protein